MQEEGREETVFWRNVQVRVPESLDHRREIEDGWQHPLVIHFCEEHRGRKQDILLRVLSSHLTALDRQTTESVNIIQAGMNPGMALNNKSEWGGAKVP